MGTGYGIYNETLSNDAKSSISADMAKIKVGYGVREAYAIEFSIDYIDNTEKLFTANDATKYGLNIELIKAFDFGIYINPFVKAGFGMGYIETTAKEESDSLSYGSYNLGLGTFIPINEHLDIELAYDYRYISYEKVDFNSQTDIEKSMSHIGYLGVNVRF